MRILERLADGGTLTPNEMAESLGPSQQNVSPSLAGYVQALLDGLVASDEPRNPLSVPALGFERMDVVVRHAEHPQPQRSSIPTRK